MIEGSLTSALFVDTPLLMTPDAAMASAMWAFSASAKPPPLTADAERGYRLENGVAVAPLAGVLFSRRSRGASYERLRSTLARIAEDSEARGVMLDIDSPGGETAGATEIADFIRWVDGAKPVVAFINSQAMSAAYVVAAAAREIVVTPSSSTGSIGVVYLHFDRSEAHAKNGVKPTLVHAGAYKIDGNSLQPLAAGARARIQTRIGDVYSLLVRTVGRLRPQLGEGGARRTEAATYFGAKAIAAGLADHIGNREDAIGRARTLAASRVPRSIAPAAAYIARSQSITKGSPMNAVYQAAHAPASAQSQADIDQMYSDMAAKLNATLPSGAIIPAKARRPSSVAPGYGRSPMNGASQATRQPLAAQSQADIDQMYGDIAAELNATLPAGAIIPPKARRF